MSKRSWNGDGLSVVAHADGNRLHIRAGDGELDTRWTLSQTDALALIAATATTRRFGHWNLDPADTLSVIATVTAALSDG